MTPRQELIEFIKNLTPERAEKILPIMDEAIKMIRQGKSDDEIKAHFGLA